MRPPQKIDITFEDVITQTNIKVPYIKIEDVVNFISNVRDYADLYIDNKIIKRISGSLDAIISDISIGNKDIITDYKKEIKRLEKENNELKEKYSKLCSHHNVNCTCNEILG